ncbi:hypothetical protein Tco_0684707 [Tanacetum coccineum]
MIERRETLFNQDQELEERAESKLSADSGECVVYCAENIHVRGEEKIKPHTQTAQIMEANEIYAKDEKLKKYRRIGMKAVKEKEQLQKIVDSWKNSSKNLWKLVDSGVPHPLTGDYTPKPQEDIDDSLYVYGKKGPQKPEISDSDDNSTEHSTCQSNDSEGSFGNPSEHSSESESESISVPNEMSTSKSVTANEKVVSESKEVEPSCVTHVKTPRKQMKNQETHEVKRKNWNEMMGRELGEGYSFIKKKCFVCGSLSHLIKDCDYYEKKMAREADLKKQRVFNTGNKAAKPVWNNANRVNRANHFVPRPVKLNADRSNVNTGRANVNSVKSNVNSVRNNVNSVRTNVNTGRFKQPVPTSKSNSFSPVRPQVILKQIPAFNFFCASFESITAIEMLGKWEKGNGKDIPKLLYLQFFDGGKRWSLGRGLAELAPKVILHPQFPISALVTT